MSGIDERPISVYAICAKCNRFNWWNIIGNETKRIGYLNHENYHPDMLDDDGGICVGRVNVGFNVYRNLESFITLIEYFKCSYCSHSVFEMDIEWKQLIEYLRRNWEERS